MLIKKEAFVMVLVLSLFLVVSSVNAECPDDFPCTIGGCSGICRNNICESVDANCPGDGGISSDISGGIDETFEEAGLHLEVPEGPNRLDVLKSKVSNIFSKLGSANKYIYFGGGFFVFILVVAIVLFAIFRKGGTEPEELELDKVYFKFPSEKADETKGVD